MMQSKKRYANPLPMATLKICQEKESRWTCLTGNAHQVHLRMSYSILKNAGIKPGEIDLKRQLSKLKQEIKALDRKKDKPEREELVEKLNQSLITHNIKMERLRRR